MTDSTARISQEPPGCAAGEGRRANLAWAGLVLLACLQPLAQLTSRYDWRADLLSHFPEPALFFTTVLFGIALRRRRKLAMVLAVLACWQTAMVFRYAVPNPVEPDVGSPARLKVLMANVLIDNDNYESLAHLIRRERPDIVGLVEYTHAWQAGLGDVRNEFSQVAEFPAGASGVALWFRRPGAEIGRAERLRPFDRPFLQAAFEFAGARRHLFLLHPRQPLDPRAREAGNPELTALAEYIRAVGGSRVVMGDLNTSDGSSNFAAFVQATGLRDSRFGFGRQGSFPTFSAYRIAIDHALVPPDLAVVERRLGPSIGSDHYPLIFVLAPASGRKAAITSRTNPSQSMP